METALENIQIDWRNLFEKMSMGYAVHKIIWDKKGEAADIVYLEVNSVYEKLTGLTKEKVVNKPVSKSIPGLEREWYERYGKVVKTGKSISFDQEAAALGKVFQVYAFKAGKDMFATIFSDISEQSKSKKILANEKLLVDTLINSMTDFIFSKDINGRYLDCNDAFAGIFVGKPKEGIIGKTDKELFGDKESIKLNFILEKDKEVFEKGENIKVEWEAKLANGKIVRLETIKTRLKDTSGKIAGLVGVSRDITERKKNEEELKDKVRAAEIMNKIMVDREIKMIELKKEVATLKNSNKSIKENEK